MLVLLGTALRGGVHVNGVLICRRRLWGIYVGRVLFPWVLWSMLSGARHLLSALALRMCVCWAYCCGSADPVFLCFVSFVRPPSGFLVSFVLPLGFGFAVSLCLFKPIGSAGMGWRHCWIRGYPEVALSVSMLWRIFFVVLSFLLLRVMARS